MKPGIRRHVSRLIEVSPASTIITRWRLGEKSVRCRDRVAQEEPLEIQVEGRSISITMRTPGFDEELAAGFLLTEGLIQRAGDIAAIRRYPRNADGNVINVHLAEGVEVDYAALTRHVFASSSCGLCGKASIQQVHRRFKALKGNCVVDGRVVVTLPDRMRAKQKSFEETGGLHAAALFGMDGTLRVLREDVGRHNAVDKVLGHALMAGWLPLDDSILMVSGRASFEILQKALAGRVPVVSAVSAPSSLAVQFARKSRQVLIGFLRGNQFNVYSGQRCVK